jgi:hypothetical protein
VALILEMGVYILEVAGGGSYGQQIDTEEWFDTFFVSHLWRQQGFAFGDIKF